MKLTLDIDPTYQTMPKESMDAVKERFPLMIQAALVSRFLQELPNISRDVGSQISDVYNRLDQIQQKFLR
jgi:hypothetical protein